VAAQINAIAAGKSSAVPWGPDASFYPRQVAPGRGVAAVGRTGRDFVTFGQGATASGAPAAIICLEQHVRPAFAAFGPNVTVNAQPAAGWMKYPALVRHYAAARAIAIPLHRQESVAGLSTLADALGMGRAVLATRHPLIDLDIEQAGIGRWVAPGDVDGWRDAIRWVEDHPDEVAAMGRRARQLVDDGFNAQAFSSRVLATFDGLSATH
jgi:glycosyltransferase involved in cell wall biosynthesis